MNHLMCGVEVERRKAVRNVVHDFREYASQPEHYNGPKLWIIHRSNDYLGAVRHFLDENPINASAGLVLACRFNYLPGCPDDGSAIRDAYSYSVGLSLMRNIRRFNFDHNGKRERY